MGKREVLNERAPISPVSVEVFNMLSTPALVQESCGGGERCDRDAPVFADILLALLFRPLALEIASAEGIVLPGVVCGRGRK